jgi:hypothetical protein
MKKILIFGDSHVGSLKVIQNQVQSNIAQCDMIGFPLPIAGLLDFSNGSLRMTQQSNFEATSHGHNSEDLKRWSAQTNAVITSIDKSGCIDLLGYDSIVIYGGHFIYRQWWKFPTVSDSYSSDLKHEIVKELLSKTQHFAWLDKVKEAVGNNVRVYSMPEPILNELVWGYEGEIAQDIGYLKNIPKDANYFDNIKLLEQVLYERGSSFFPLPELLYENNNSISAKYKSTDPKDFIHLNSEGARLVLENVLAVV